MKNEPQGGVTPPFRATPATQDHRLRPPAHVAEIADALPEDPLVPGQGVPYFLQGFQEALPRLDQRRILGRRIPIEAAFEPETDSADLLVAAPGWIRTTTAGSKDPFFGRFCRDLKRQKSIDQWKDWALGGLDLRAHSPSVR